MSKAKVDREAVKAAADRAEGLKPDGPERPGRPTAYRDTYAKQAEKLCKLGATDEGIAFFFDVPLEMVAEWAWEHQEFFDAITPSEQTVARWTRERLERFAKRNERRREKRAADPGGRLLDATRARIWAALKGQSDGALFSRLGYSRRELMASLESKFAPGMSWENYGLWHVDHIKPCAAFDMAAADQFDEAWGLRNLQPLWAAENIRKGARYAGS